jgi:hypothetical protein
MASILSGFLLVALSSSGFGGEAGLNASAMRYSVQFDESTGSATLACKGSSSGSCTFWVGDTSAQRQSADASGTLAAGGVPAIVRLNTTNPGYCVGLDVAAPPRWPDCAHGPLGGALDRSATVDYRWK